MSSNEQIVTNIRSQMVIVETQGLGPLDPSGNFVSYPGIPPKGTNLKYPFAYRLWAYSQYGGNEDPMKRTRSAGRGAIDRTRVHFFWVYLHLADRADPAGLAKLDALSTHWVDDFDSVYRAHSTLWTPEMGSVCGVAEVLRAKPAADKLLGPEHWGILFTVRVEAIPLVVSGP